MMRIVITAGLGKPLQHRFSPAGGEVSNLRFKGAGISCGCLHDAQAKAFNSRQRIAGSKHLKRPGELGEIGIQAHTQHGALMLPGMLKSA
ncbi:MAG: hypothetical protein EBS47_13085 [Betaproteobacteria bacterium]|nr:hypothetical protein [Betaproteobacteria bacterium]